MRRFAKVAARKVICFVNSYYHTTMGTLTIKLPPGLENELEHASEREHLTKSEFVRRAIAAYIAPRSAQGDFVSALDQAGDLVGCFAGGPADLSSNPRHMDDFGKA